MTDLQPTRLKRSFDFNALDDAATFVAGLDEHDFAIPGHFVADAVFVGCSVSVELLLVADPRANLEADHG